MLDAEQFDRSADEAADDVPGLAAMLVQAGHLTAYQAAALAQGKARGLVIGHYLILDKLRAGRHGGRLQGAASPDGPGRRAEDPAAVVRARPRGWSCGSAARSRSPRG